MEKVLLVPIDDGSFNRLIDDTNRRFTEDRQRIGNLETQVTIILTDRIANAIEKALVPVNSKLASLDSKIDGIHDKQAEDTKFTLRSVVGYVITFLLGVGSFIVFRLIEGIPK